MCNRKGLSSFCIRLNPISNADIRTLRNEGRRHCVVCSRLTPRLCLSSPLFFFLSTPLFSFLTYLHPLPLPPPLSSSYPSSLLPSSYLSLFLHYQYGWERATRERESPILIESCPHQCGHTAMRR
mmetsp:Transcript_38006/g.98121  ORF Transcript_38006/g.98121 Transcript_38006/m.98121 type:complete len:125 (+) Transcript_38006:458-832(+)